MAALKLTIVTLSILVGSRATTEGTYDAPGSRLGEYNTFAARRVYQIEHGENAKTDVGVSLLSGGLHDGNDRAGNYGAWAFHVNSQINNWNIQFQHGEYDYDLDDNSNRFVVGAFDYYDTVSSEATMTNFNVAYDLSVDLGPITGVQFYNDYGIIYDKSDDSADTWMNVTGMSVSAGPYLRTLTLFKHVTSHLLAEQLLVMAIQSVALTLT